VTRGCLPALPPFEILIPCKPLAEGKSRLAPVLSRQQRHELCAAMLRQTIKIVMQIVRREHIWLTTSDELAAAIVREYGITVIPESGNDLNGALELARRHIQKRTCADLHGLMVLPIDLPLVDVAAVKRPVVDGAEVVVASNRAKTGTNLLYLTGAAAAKFPFSYGKNSFPRHCELARCSRYTLSVIDDSGLAFDLDEPSDLLQLPRSVALSQAVEEHVGR
jgi:2-phospho-L-lactate/phosphoenolpyruvate guanylyltransferase